MLECLLFFFFVFTLSYANSITIENNQAKHFIRQPAGGLGVCYWERELQEENQLQKCHCDSRCLKQT